MKKLLVWDAPVRLFHWGSVLLVALAYYTMKTEGAPFIFPTEVHARAGYLLVGLLLFRWLWGLVGSAHARFAGFLHSPRRILDYARQWLGGHRPVFAGHNPLGGAMVMIMLLSLSAQALSGLFLTDDIFFSAPLHAWVGGELAGALKRLHQLNANLLATLIALHLLALVVHRLLGERLVGAMLTGRKSLPGPAQDRPAASPLTRPWLALALGVVVSLPVLWLWQA